MSIPKYAVLVGRAVDRRFATTKSNHYEIKISSAGQTYRIAVNVQSADGSEVLYAMRDPFQFAELARRQERERVLDVGGPDGVVRQFRRLVFAQP